MHNEDKLREYLKRATTDLRQARKRLTERDERDSEPIAIVGIGCRFPGGVHSPEDLWRLVSEGTDAISGFPEDRGWDLDALYDPDPDTLNTVYTRQGGFLYDAADFDPAFFGINRREALAMDPQQRLLLETSWEAIERAGIDPATLKGSSTGVFAGVMYHDYASRLVSFPDSVQGLLSTGNSGSVASGRIAYTLGLEGPAVTIDTACSSSLVSLHLAARALRSGECTMALAGGVSIMAGPSSFVEFSRQRGLAPDGRCKAFSDDADGASWAEGAGMLLVERLSDAQRNGHPILAVLRGSAVNQDGASNGLTAPNGPSQQRVILAALESARLGPGDVDVVEAHGTGTPLGDPIEAQALLATYGQDRTKNLLLGSVKSNIGHTQAAAGAAGVIKMIMAMKHGIVPATLHADSPSGQVDWTAGSVRLATEQTPWPSDAQSDVERPRRAAVSSFGISGTNAHVVLEQAPAPAPTEAPTEAPTVQPGTAISWPVSARTQAALGEQARRLITRLPDASDIDIARSLAVSRSAFEFKAVVTAQNRSDLVAGLAALSSGETHPALVVAEAAASGRTAMLFSGQGAQRVGMGRELYDAYPVFADAFDAACAHLPSGLSEVVFGQDTELLAQTGHTQPALFALETALFRLLESWGVRADVLVGHSVGEIAAAHVAGVLDLADAAALVTARSALMQALPTGGSMVAIEATEMELVPLLTDKVGIAAVNAAHSVVVSGDTDDVAAIAAQFAVRGRKITELNVSHAFHSPAMDPILNDFRAVVEGLRFQQPQIPMITTGRTTDGDVTTVDYWVEHVSATVRFGDAAALLAGRGVGTTVEIGPGSTLTSLVAQTNDQLTALAPLRSSRPETSALGVLHTAGVGIDWERVTAGSTDTHVDLPTYAFQYERFWLESPTGPADVSSAGLGSADHPLLGAAVSLADDGGYLLTGVLSASSQPWLAEHSVAGTTVLASSVFVELALHAADRTGLTRVAELNIHTPAVLQDNGLTVQVSVAAATDESTDRGIRIHARPGTSDTEPGEWTLHATGVLSAEAVDRADSPLAQWPPAGASPLPLDLLAAHRAAADVHVGPMFDGITGAFRSDGSVYSEIELKPSTAAEGYGLHPALLESALSVEQYAQAVEPGVHRFPSRWRDVVLHAVGATRVRTHLSGFGSGSGSVTVADADGTVVATAADVAFDSVPVDRLVSGVSAARSLHCIEWTPIPAATDIDTGSWAVLGSPDDLAFEGIQSFPTVHELTDGTSAPSVVVHRADGGTLGILHTVQHWLAEPALAATELVVVTAGAVGALDTDDVPALDDAGIWGLLRSARTEHPGRFTLLDIEPGAVLDPAALATLVASGDGQGAVRGSDVVVPRLVRVDVDPTSVAPKYDPESSVLITGGTGALGIVLARHLVFARGARHLVLMSRSGGDANSVAALQEEMSAVGATLDVATADVADADAVGRIVDSLTHPLTAVYHTAAVVDGGVIDTLDDDALGRVLHAKATGARVLHAATADLPLTEFVLFSSLSGVLGGAGSGAYAAANATLDALAQHRRAVGLPATSLAWGLWEERGAQTELDARDLERMNRSGILPLTSKDALASMDVAARPELLSTALFVPARLNLHAFGAQLPPILSGLIGRAGRRTASAGTTHSFVQTLSAQTVDERERAVTTLVRDCVATVLTLPSAAAVNTGSAFHDIGFDSLTSMELRNALAGATGLTLPASLTFDYPTPRQLTEFLLTELSGIDDSTFAPTAASAPDDDPIVIVSMSCNFPGGARSPEQLWRVVSEGVDTMSDLPTDRGWDLAQLFDADPDVPRTSYVQHGAFLDRATHFDAKFFGIGPHEARAMDPQQRLLLENTWELFERAGVDADSLRGSSTGVFVGTNGQDYASLLPHGGAESEAHALTANSASVISGRLAYTFGLEGPAITVDTACSSSLVSLHLAAKALKSGECSLAVAGGVTVMATPNSFVAFSRQRGLAPDGRCKAFSDDADGTGWGEGVGLLLLERQSDAVRNGHDILAVVGGSAVNQDGASNGLTAPNGPSQQRVIRQALADAGVDPSDIDVVEAHGTGTPLGDPIEAGALLATYGRNRLTPLHLGSIKSNIGHTQAAAGVAGVIKMVLALRHDLLPKTLHAETPSSKVQWSSGSVQVLRDHAPWPASDRVRRAAVSAFGVSGTNAHVIIEEAPAAVRKTVESRSHPSVPWVLSARSDTAVRDAATRLLKLDAPALDVAYSLATSRAHLDHRAAVTGTSIDELRAGLNAIADGTTPVTAVNTGPLTFAFSGQGSQTPDMGRELYETYPLFAETFDEIQALLGLDLHGLDADALNQTGNTQPALFALQISLARLLQSYGVTPDVLIGHSIGEIAAAHIAGILTLEDAAALVSARASLMQALPAGGAMTAIAATEDEITPHLTDTVSIAAINAPQSLVVSGAQADVDAIAAHFTDQGRKTTSLKVSHAFHSPLMTPMLENFRAAIEHITFDQPKIPLVTSGDPTTADYWIDHILATVRYADTINTLVEHNVSTLVEIGPGTTLTALTNLNTDTITTIPTQLTPRERVITADGNYARTGGAAAFTTALAHIHTTGHHIDWTTYYHGTGATRTTLPTYAFQRERFWLDAPAAAAVASAATTVDDGFWSGVESEDIDSLAATLGLATSDLAPVLPKLSAWRRRRRESGVVDGWRYRTALRPLDSETSVQLSGTWLLFVPDAIDAPAHHRVGVVADALSARGAHPVTVRMEQGATRESLADVVRSGPDAAGALLFTSASNDLSATVLAVQALVDAECGGPIWNLTQGAVSTGRSDAPVDARASAQWGFGRSAALELPRKWGGSIDLPLEWDDRVAGRFASALTRNDGEDQIAVRSSGSYAARLDHAPAQLDRSDAASSRWSPRGTSLITGGTGGIGGHLTRWLAELGAERVVLASRRGTDASGAAELVSDAAAFGCTVDVVRCDVTDRDALAGVVDSIDDLTAVFHAAGAEQFSALADITPADVHSVLAAKTIGADNLDSLLVDTALDAFVLFSSIAGVWGSGHQSIYSAANAHLDGLACSRRARGARATSIAWGPWAGSGMVDDVADAQLRRRGVVPMTSTAALAALRIALDENDTTVVVADIDWTTFAGSFTAARPSPLLSSIPEATTESTTTAATAAASTWHQQIAALDETDRRGAVVDVVRAAAAQVLGYSAATDLDISRAFQEQGVDSLTAVTLRNRLVGETGLTLPTTLVFDYPDVLTLADFLLAQLDLSDQVAVTGPASTSVAEDPIVIVGMGCRLPGDVNSPDDLWSLLVDGVDAVSEFPTDRGWNTDAVYDPNPERSGTSYTRSGGFLSGAADFDAGFFGISPREALAMDPQQRILLETSWETVERAGIDPASLRGSRTGVFVGVAYQGYGVGDTTEEIQGLQLTGTATSVVSGRIAYSLGLEGPAITVDTACSSSLVSLHLAVQALRNGECDLSLVGGVTVMPTPSTFVEFSRQRGLSADGRCKAYADSADGTGWAEGAGMILVERMSDALRQGHDVLAVVRGSAINQDGASNGLTAPNGPAQQRVIRAALAASGLSGNDVDVVEGHGTGTTLGDPIEAGALLATYGLDRSTPLWLGSLKSNIGHTQAAAGVAGIIKMVLALRHRVMPRTLHSEVPSTRVEWAPGAVELLTSNREWEASERPRRAAVSAFGVSGTNAHTILEEYVAEEYVTGAGTQTNSPTDPRPAVWALSAADGHSLQNQIVRLRDFLGADPDAAPDNIGFSLATTRSALSHRVAVVGRTNEELLAALGSAGDGERTGTAGTTAFAFSGQGSQRAGMGCALYETYPVFADAFDLACSYLDPHLDRPLRAVVFDADSQLIGDTGYTQPALFAIETALFRLLESWGVRPQVVIGHSVGEIAAAHVAGVLSLDDAATLVCARASAMQALAAGGAMTAVDAAEAEVLPLLSDTVSIAAVNGADSVVVSGDAEEVARIRRHFDDLGRKTTPLQVSHAFHSPSMAPMVEDFGRVVEQLDFRTPKIAMVSTGGSTDADIASPRYWVDHVLATVRFADALEALVDRGVGTIVEVGPGAALTSLVRRSHSDVLAVPLLRDLADEAASIVSALAAVHVAGGRVDWTSFYAGARRVELPTYAFHHERFWLEPHQLTAVSDPIDTEFWATIEREDIESLSTTLGLDADDTVHTLIPKLSAWRRHHRQQAEIESLRYETRWTAVEPASTSTNLGGSWLIVTRSEMAENSSDIESTLRDHGADVSTVTIGEDRETTAALLRSTNSDSIVALGLTAGELLRLTQSVGDAGQASTLWCLTRGAVTTGRSDAPVDPHRTTLWGLGRTIALEASARWGGLLDLPANLDDRAATRVAAVLSGTGEDQVAVRSSGTFARRLVPSTRTKQHSWTPRGTVLITGGTGALGAHVARWAAAAGAQHLVLTSRRGLHAPGAQGLHDELEALGTRVTISSCDVSAPDGVADLVDGLDITAVIHTAGVDHVTALDELTEDEFDDVLRAKVRGAENLDSSLGDTALDAFVLFSSISGVWGAGHQGAYAAANAYLDGLAENRRSRGLTATSVSWGPWADGGMADSDGAADHLRRRGLTSIPAASAVSALQRALDDDVTTVTVADVDWARFIAPFTLDRPSPLLSEIPAVIDATEAEIAPSTVDSELLARIEAVDTAGASRILLDLVTETAASVLGHRDSSRLDSSRAFSELGFDSLTAIELRNTLTSATGLSLPASIVFDYPTAAALAEHLRRELVTDLAADLADSPRPVVSDDDPIVIVSMSCRFPGGADSPEALWNLVSEGVDAVGEFPVDRHWDLDGLYDSDPDHSGTSYSRHGGFLYEAAQFDPAFFGISPREATAMDPQQRLLLQISWELFERAGIDPTSMHGTDTAVFIGSGYQDYGNLVLAAGAEAEGYMGTGNSASVLAGRLAYVYGLEGPTATVDTACSSSLVALHMAAGAVRNGECSMAIAGGVTVMSTPGPFIEFSRQRGLSIDGRCKAFSDGADGTGWAEGAGLLLVERLSDAERLGHDVLAVVRGSAMNSDGASNGLTAPNGPAQQRVIRAALAASGLSTSEVDVVEAHGTGTTLGDPIEAQALLATYGRERDVPLLLGSLKSNIGHAQAAAGVGGIIKMVMAMAHGIAPRTLHAEQPSSHVDWTAGSVSLLTEHTPWPDLGRPRRAAVSAFGVSGTNAHTVLEQAPESVRPVGAKSSGPYTWVLSAKSTAALADNARRLLDADPADPLDIAFSLATGRSALPYRAAVVGTTSEILRDGLEAVASGTTAATHATGAGRIAFAFSGQGSQTPGMGRALYENYPVFANAFDDVCSHLDPHLDTPLRDIIFDTDADTLNQTGNTQPALFALQVSLARLLQSYGVTPDVLIGHSIGEIAAAHIAGILSLEDAAALVSARASLMQALPAGGAMTAIAATEDEITPLLTSDTSIAAINAPQSLVVSGAQDDVARIAQHFADLGRKTTSLKVSHAFHSPLMTPMLDAFRTVAQDLTFNQPSITLITSGDPTTADYWIDHILATVRYADTITSLVEQNVSTLVEIGPGTTLTALTNLNTDTITAIPTQLTPRERVITPDGNYPRTGGAAAFTTALAHIHTTGHHIDWTTYYHGTGAQRTTLPTYAFQNETFWLNTPQASVVEQDPVDAEFWAVVERGDIGPIATELGLDPSALTDVVPSLSAWRRSRRADSAVDSWRYRVDWTPVATVDNAQLDGTWLLLTSAVSEPVLDSALSSRGASVVTVPVTHSGTAPGDETIGALSGLDDIAGVVFVVDSAADGADPAKTTLLLVKALGEAKIEAPLWVLTRGAVVTGRSDHRLDPTLAETWGLGRVAALEHSARWGGLIDLPAVLDDRSAARVVGILSGSDSEDQLAVRSSGVFGRRLHRLPASSSRRAAWTARGTVVVTGGTGALGGHVARWLATRGAEHLVLLGRRGLASPGASDLVAELEESGVRVTVAECDVADRSALAAIIDDIDASDTPLTAVVHTAGVDQLEPMASMTTEEFDLVRSAKVRGAANLDELVGSRELDAFVLFSSIAGVWGSGHQAAYAAGNAYLDGLAHNRRLRGLTATAVSWGPWGDGGMADGEAEEQLRRRGLTRMPAAQAVLALGRALTEDLTTVTVADVEWTKFIAPFSLVRPTPLLASFAELEQTATEDAAETNSDNALVARLRTQDPTAQRRTLAGEVIAQAAAVLGHKNSAAIEPDTAFQELGFDSLTAVELRNALGNATSTVLPATVVFDYPTANALAEFLRTELVGAADVDVPDPVNDAAASDDPIVIVGMSCRYPGGVHSPEDLWEMAFQGRDVVGDFPTDRGWDTDSLYDSRRSTSGTTYTKSGGFLYEAAEFDPSFFGISPREAVSMDPQQRMLLETSWELFEHAGIDVSGMRGSRTGVFVGSGYQDYAAQLLSAGEAGEGYLGTGNSASVISGRLSYTYGFEGPAVTVDTACSSSLVALHLATQAIRNGECTMALAGGVMVMSTPTAFVEFSKQGGLSPDGRCKAFSEAADGTGWAEGIGLVLVERMSDARRAGHDILAVVRGSAINQDGASNGLTAPNGPAQQRVIRQALSSAGLRSSDVDLVEGHGTGTTLGDPIEAQALLATYGQDRDTPLWLGSLKSNMGHAQAAAGVAGVIKMVMAMRHGVMPRTLHVDEPATRVDWTSGSVQLLSEQRPWPELDRPRRAAVSAFGVSGTNAHTILEAPPQLEPAVTVAQPRQVSVIPVLLSGKSPEALREQARRLIESGRVEAKPLDTAFTLATTRAVHGHRAAVVAGDPADLTSALTAVSEGESHPAVVSGSGASGQLAFAFSGQGSQTPGMGRALYENYPVFANSFDDVCSHLDPHLDTPLRDIIFDTDADTLNQTGNTQPALFALQVSLARLLQSYGVTPDVLIGHSIGEIAAAHIAGILSLQDAAALVSARASLMQALPAGGAMTAIAATEDEITPHLTDTVSIAAINAPQSLVVSGAQDDVARIAQHFADQGRKTTSLKVSHAFHSPLMTPMLETFRTAIEHITFNQPSIPLITTGDPTTADYWIDHILATVRYADTINTLAGQNVSTLVEIGPGTTLTALTNLNTDQITAIPTQLTPRERVITADGNYARTGGAAAFTTALAHIHTTGHHIDWTTYYHGTGAQRTTLPTYAFQRQHYWLTVPTAVPSDVDPVEAEFWNTVEREDLEGLASVLEIEAGESFEDVLPRLSAWRRSSREHTVVDGLRHREAWTKDTSVVSSAELRGKWLLATTSAGSDPVTEWCVAALADVGAEIVRVEVDSSSVRNVLGEQLTRHRDVTGIVSTLGVTHDAASTVTLIQALGDAQVQAPLWCVTTGAVSVADEPVAHPEQTMIWGLGRVAALEHSARWGGLIDLPSDIASTAASTDAVGDLLRSRLASSSTEDQTALRRSGVHFRRIVRDTRDPKSSTPWQPRGTVLVTGGTGALGGHVARWAASEGAEHVVLTSRRGSEAPGVAELIADIEQHGAAVTVTSCDMSDAAAVAQLVAAHDFTAVVHTAGTAEAAMLDATTPAEFRSTLAAKADGAANLHAALADRVLDAFVMFSSIAGIWGGGGQAAYSAANAYLDGLAQHRRSLGLAATAVAWGPWSGGGMVADGEEESRLARRGLSTLSPSTALAALRRITSSGFDRGIVVDIDWARFAEPFTAVRPSPLISDLTQSSVVPKDPAAEDDKAAFAVALAALPAAEHERAISTMVRERVAAVLGYTGADSIDGARAFTDLGFDSLTAVELRNALRTQTGLDLPATVVFDYPTPNALVQYLLAELAGEDQQGGSSVFGDLDRLATSISGASDDAVRVRIRQRLHDLLAGLEEPSSSNDHSDLESATAEDIFDLIDQDISRT